MQRKEERHALHLGMSYFRHRSWPRYLVLGMLSRGSRFLVTVRIFQLQLTIDSIIPQYCAAFLDIGVLDRMFIMAGSVTTMGGVHAVLKHFYSNMVQAAARENDQAGLVITHTACRWIRKRISTISTFRQRQAGLASLGGAMALQPLGGKLKVWISQAVCHNPFS